MSLNLSVMIRFVTTLVNLEGYHYHIKITTTLPTCQNIYWGRGWGGGGLSVKYWSLETLFESPLWSELNAVNS